MTKIRNHQRCEKKKFSKCDEVCKLYEGRGKYAEKLEADEKVRSFRCNVTIGDSDYCSDFMVERQDGSVYIRECVYRDSLSRQGLWKGLEQSYNYWRGKSIEWGLVVMGGKKDGEV